MGESQEGRVEAARQGEALPDGSYAVRDCGELGKAIKQLEGEAGESPRVRRHLIRRAVELGCTEKLPDSWEAE